jgi:hypothetical protein
MGLRTKPVFLSCFFYRVRGIEWLGVYEDLLEGGVVEAGIMRQVVHVGDNVGDLSESVNAVGSD